MLRPAFPSSGRGFGPLASLTLAALALLASEGASAAETADDPTGWRRTDTARCRIHWSGATPRAAARVAAVCDSVVTRAVGDEQVVDVVVEAGAIRPWASDGIAHVPAAPSDDRAVGGPPTLAAALARAVGAAASQLAEGGVRLEVSALGRHAGAGLSAGGVAILGDAHLPAGREAGDAQLRAERAGGPAWTTLRDMALRVAVRHSALLGPRELELPNGPGALHRRLVAVQGYSFARFLSERYDGDPWAHGVPGDLHADWLARAQAVYADQVEAIGEEVGGAPAAAEDPAYSWPMAGADLDRLRPSPDGRWLSWTDGDQAVLTERRGAPEVEARTLRIWAPGGLDWAPDSARVAVADGQLWVRRLPEGRGRRLTEGLSVVDPAWSPSGDRVAFVHRRDGRSWLGLLDPEDVGRGITWILAPEDGAWIGRPDWSADGRWLVFEMYRGGRWDLWAVGRGGGDLRPLTWDSARERDPVIDPRGRAVWFSSDATGVFDLRRLDLLTGQVERITRVHGGALSPAVTSEGVLLFLYYGPGGLVPHRIDGPAALERLPSPRPSSLAVASSLLPDPTALADSGPPAPGWPLLPISVLPQALWDEALSAGVRLRARTPAGSSLAAGVLLGSAWALDLEVAGGGRVAPFAAARWLSVDRPLSVGVDGDGDPATLGPAVAAPGDGAAAWRTARLGVRAELSERLGLEAFVDLLDADGDGRLDGRGGGGVRRGGGGVGLDLGGVADPVGRLRVEAAVFAADLRAAVWDGVEEIGRSDAAGGPFDYAYERALLDAAVRLYAPWVTDGGRRLELRLRGGWIGRNVSPEEELFAGAVHPADRLRPGRATFDLAGFDEFAVRGETLLLVGLAWRLPLATRWRGAAGPLALSGGWLELFADAGNAWGHSARWQRTAGGALVLDDAGRPTPVPGTVRRDNPLQHAGAAGPRLLTEVGVELGVGLRLFHAPWGSTLRMAYGFQAVRGPGDTNGDGLVAWTDPSDPLGSEEAPAGLRISVALGTGLP